MWLRAPPSSPASVAADSSGTRWVRSPSAMRSAVAVICLIGRIPRRTTHHVTDAEHGDDDRRRQDLDEDQPVDGVVDVGERLGGDPDLAVAGAAGHDAVARAAVLLGVDGERPAVGVGAGRRPGPGSTSGVASPAKSDPAFVVSSPGAVEAADVEVRRPDGRRRPARDRRHRAAGRGNRGPPATASRSSTWSMRWARVVVVTISATTTSVTTTSPIPASRRARRDSLSTVSLGTGSCSRRRAAS